MHIKIIYETQTGTTEYVAQLLEEQFTKAGHQVKLHSIKYGGPTPDLNGIDLVLIGGPTYDDGLLLREMREWITTFKPDFSQHKIAVFGLGNRNYPQFCIAASILEDWVKAQGGTLLVPALRVDGFPVNTEPVTTFATQILQALK